MDAELVMQGLEMLEPDRNGLFAYPAQSNFSGVQHPLEWVELAQEHGWDVLLDSAAFVATNRLDLSAVSPDFVPLSFYKMFGYPTGVGALLARKEALGKLRRPWFAGGTITLASVSAGIHRLAPGHTGFEDGTVDYLSLPAITTGLRHVAEIGIETIHTHVMSLAGWLLGEMRAMRHGNGKPLVRLFGPETAESRGATLAFYLLDPDGSVFDVYRVEELAGRENISVRTGCFCNPGDGEKAHSLSAEEISKCFVASRVPVTLADCQRLIEDATGKVPNTIRASLGWASSFSDVYRFREFVSSFRDTSVEQVGRGSGLDGR
jgi:selenocysteine lyase/cysteine desulfurase